MSLTHTTASPHNEKRESGYPIERATRNKEQVSASARVGGTSLGSFAWNGYNTDAVSRAASGG